MEMRRKEAAAGVTTILTVTRPRVLPDEPHVFNASLSFGATPEAGPRASHNYLPPMQLVNIFPGTSTLNS